MLSNFNLSDSGSCRKERCSPWACWNKHAGTMQSPTPGRVHEIFQLPVEALGEARISGKRLFMSCLSNQGQSRRVTLLNKFLIDMESYASRIRKQESSAPIVLQRGGAGVPVDGTRRESSGGAPPFRNWERRPV